MQRLLRSDRAAALVVLVALGLFFAQLELRHPSYFLWDDNASEFLPGFVYTYESLAKEGHLAQLNYHQYLGYTHLASGQVGVLYPPVYVAMGFSEKVLGDFRYGLDVLAIGHFLFAGLGMLLVLRRFRVERPVAVAMAILWATSPFFVQLGRSWIHVAFTAAWLPWSFYFLHRLLEKPTPGRVVTLALAKALFFFQGHPHFFLLVAAGEGLFLLVRWLGQRDGRAAWRELRALTLAALGAACLAAPLILPMWAALRVSAARAKALPIEEFVSNALSVSVAGLAQLLRMEPAVHWATGAIFYVGLPHVIALIWLWRHRREVGQGPLAAVLVSGVAFASATSLWGMFYGLPLVSSLRWPFKAFGVSVFYLFIALAGGYTAMVAAKPAVRRLAGFLLTLSLAAHLMIVGHGEWDRPLGPNRIDRDVQQIRQEVAAVIPRDQGRVVSMWLSPLEPRLDRFLIFQYATLAGAYHLGGYEPMIAKQNFELSKNLEYSNIYRYRLTRQSLDDLSARSVRFLIVPTREEFQETLNSFPELRRVHRDELLEVWENGRALPFAFFRHGPYNALPIKLSPRGIDIETSGEGGLLTLTVAPLDGYVWSADGEPMGAIGGDGQRVMLEVPPGTRNVSVRYQDVPFQIGIALALACLLSLVGVALARRLRSGKSR